MLPLNRELAALKFLDGLASLLRDVREPHKALRHALRDTREFFQAAHGCIAAELRPKFSVFTKDELLTDMEYGGTPFSRAVINVNVAFQEFAKR